MGRRGEGTKSGLGIGLAGKTSGMQLVDFVMHADEKRWQRIA